MQRPEAGEGKGVPLGVGNDLETAIEVRSNPESVAAKYVLGLSPATWSPRTFPVQHNRTARESDHVPHQDPVSTASGISFNSENSGFAPCTALVHGRNIQLHPSVTLQQKGFHFPDFAISLGVCHFSRLTKTGSVPKAKKWNPYCQSRTTSRKK